VKLLLTLLALICLMTVAAAQDQEPPKKANARTETAQTENAPEPFDGASVEKMAAQCVTLETDLGAIEMAMMPEVAPESVRNFLNLSATGALDTTTFSRVVKGFVIQGGNLSTSEKWGAELAKRMSRHLPDGAEMIGAVRDDGYSRRHVLLRQIRLGSHGLS